MGLTLTGSAACFGDITHKLVIHAVFHLWLPITAAIGKNGINAPSGAAIALLHQKVLDNPLSLADYCVNSISQAAHGSWATPRSFHAETAAFSLGTRG